MSQTPMTYLGHPCKRGHDGTRYAGNRVCVECSALQTAKWHKANRGRARAIKVEWRKANPLRGRAYIAAWQAANSERVRANKAAWAKANPEKVRGAGAAWVKANPSACVATNARRNAIKRNALGRGVSAAEWKNCIAESLGICAYCNERRHLTMDHIEPLARGGEQDIDNIAAACKSCNSSKGTKSLVVWLASRAQARAA